MFHSYILLPQKWNNTVSFLMSKVTEESCCPYCHSEGQNPEEYILS